MRTPLRDIPREWLIDIEPRLARGGVLKECWIWTAGLDHEGHPTRARRAARYIAKMFWPKIQSYHEVLHDCGNVSCLNPGHFRISHAHWTHEDRSPSQELASEAGSPVSGIHTRGKPKPLDSEGDQ
jgi:hypothetical protein